MASNKEVVARTLTEAGITNRFSIAAIMAIIEKESGFKPRSETSYARTSNARIKSIFSKTKPLTDAQLTKLKSNDFDFFNFIYGGRYGNTESEGFKYRGRGLNQLTFKGNYIKYGRLTNTDLVNKPDLANDLKVASNVVAQYFLEQFKDNQKLIESRYKVKNINDFKDTKNAVNAFYNANAGFGKDTSNIVAEGKTRALNVVDSFLKYAKEYKTPIGLGVFLLLAGAGVYVKNQLL
jgi:predicted chitinase